LLAHGRWFSPGTLSSSTTKTGCHDIAEILLKVVFNTIKQIKSGIKLSIFATVPVGLPKRNKNLEDHKKMLGSQQLTFYMKY